MGTCDIGWTGAMGLIHGGTPWGHATQAGSGRWDWFMGYVMGAHDWIRFEGACHWDVTLAGTRHGGATGSKRWDRFVGARHGGATLAGCELWDWFMGVFHGARNWIGAMELICRGEPWGRMTLARSGWGDWIMWARHQGVPHWLDWGYGIDSWRRVEWQSTIWLLNVNDKVLYGCWM